MTYNLTTSMNMLMDDHSTWMNVIHQCKWNNECIKKIVGWNPSKNHFSNLIKGTNVVRNEWKMDEWEMKNVKMIDKQEMNDGSTQWLQIIKELMWEIWYKW